MISNLSITDPTSKIIALQNLADESAQNPKCKTAYGITLQAIRKAEMKLENATKKEKNYE